MDVIVNSCTKLLELLVRCLLSKPYIIIVLKLSCCNINATKCSILKYIISKLNISYQVRC